MHHLREHQLNLPPTLAPLRARSRFANFCWLTRGTTWWEIHNSISMLLMGNPTNSQLRHFWALEASHLVCHSRHVCVSYIQPPYHYIQCQKFQKLQVEPVLPFHLCLPQPPYLNQTWPKTCNQADIMHTEFPRIPHFSHWIFGFASISWIGNGSYCSQFLREILASVYNNRYLATLHPLR